MARGRPRRGPRSPLEAARRSLQTRGARSSRSALGLAMTLTADLALLISELVTNSYRHSAESRDCIGRRTPHRGSQDWCAARSSTSGHGFRAEPVPASAGRRRLGPLHRRPARRPLGRAGRVRRRASGSRSVVRSERLGGAFGRLVENPHPSREPGHLRAAGRPTSPPLDQGESAAVLLGALMGREEQAQTARVHERDLAQVDHHLGGIIAPRPRRSAARPQAPGRGLSRPRERPRPRAPPSPIDGSITDPPDSRRRRASSLATRSEIRR